MKAWQEFTHFAGFDWAKDHDAVVIVDKGGSIVADFEFPHSAPGWKAFRQKIAQFPELAVCIETNQGAAIEQLFESVCTIYPVNPKSAQRYRERKVPSGSKTDHLDAWSMADALRTDGHGWKSLSPLDPLIHELRLLCRDEVDLIEQRTACVNRLQQALYEYYPTALEAFDDWTKPWTWAFVEQFATPGLLKKAGKRKWEEFLHSHKLWHPYTVEKRLQCFGKTGELFVSEPVVRAKSRLAIATVKVLQALEVQIEAYRLAIEKLFNEHPDHDLFGSLPGAGPKLAPRLLSEIGSDRFLFSDHQAMQCLAGTAPVSFQSGKIFQVHMRRACNKNFRHAVHLWVDESRHYCTWAQTYYATLKSKGKSHACALRCLGQRWLKILWKMWQTHTVYKPEVHAKNQLKHGSWVLKLNPA